jgi:hypothetical protein
VHADEVGLLAYMAWLNRSIDDAAAELGTIPPKRLATIRSRWVRRRWLRPGSCRLTSQGHSLGAELLREIQARVNEGPALREVLARCVAQRARPKPEARDRKPNARDLVSAAVMDVEWRLSRSRRQRASARRRQLREARWLMQRALVVLAGTVDELDYLSPRKGRHLDDDSPSRPGLPPQMAGSYRGAKVGELYRRTLGGLS